MILMKYQYYKIQYRNYLSSDVITAGINTKTEEKL